MLDALYQDILKRVSRYSVSVSFAEEQLNGMYQFDNYVKSVVRLLEPVEFEYAVRTDDIEYVRRFDTLAEIATTTCVTFMKTLESEPIALTNMKWWMGMMDCVSMANLLSALRCVRFEGKGVPQYLDVIDERTLIAVNDAARCLNLFGHVADADARDEVNVTKYSHLDMTDIVNTFLCGMGVFWREYVMNQGIVAGVFTGEDFERAYADHLKLYDRTVLSRFEDDELFGRAVGMAITAYDELQHAGHQACVAKHSESEFEFHEEILQPLVAGLMAKALALRDYDTPTYFTGWCRVGLTSPKRLVWPF